MGTVLYQLVWTVFLFDPTIARVGKNLCEHVDDRNFKSVHLFKEESKCKNALQIKLNGARAAGVFARGRCLKKVAE